MRQILESGPFKRDVKREAEGKHGKTLAAMLRPVPVAPANDEPLEPLHRDHAVTGDRHGCRECPIKPDLILIYRKPDVETLELLGLGLAFGTAGMTGPRHGKASGFRPAAGGHPPGNGAKKALAAGRARHDRDHMKVKELYEQDYYAWTQETARLLREGRLRELDIENLVEEVEDLGRSERHRLEAQLEALMEHLLYIGYLTRDPERDGHGWRYAAERARKKALILIEKNPSFKPDLGEVIENAYRSARESLLEKADIMKADHKIGYSIRRGEPPSRCPWTAEELFEAERYLIFRNVCSQVLAEKR